MSSQAPIVDLKITVKATDMDEDYMVKHFRLSNSKYNLYHFIILIFFFYI